MAAGNETGPELRYIVPMDVELGLISDPVEAAALTAVLASMGEIRDEQLTLGGLLNEDVTTKVDGTLLTPTDKRSEAIARQVFGDMLPGATFRGEEGTYVEGQENLPGWNLIVGYDPKDGTRPSAVTSPIATVLLALYDRQTGAVRGAMIGEPSTGIVMSSFGDQPTMLRRFETTANNIFTVATRADLRTWDGTMLTGGQVMLDNNQPFAREGHVTMNLRQHESLRRILGSMGVGILEFGSNGAHQLYVARGGNRAAAAVTTARGVWEDTSAGLHLIRQSGGATQTFTAADGRIRAVGPGTQEYDLAIGANNVDTLDRLTELVLTLPIK